MAPRTKKTSAAKRYSSQSRVSVQREEKSGNFLDKIQSDLEKNQSYLNLILGALIVIVLGVLVFNYFNKPSDIGNLGPSQQTSETQGDVTKGNLPGKYTVKQGDTLFLIAQNYYSDGSKYTEIIKENNLTSDRIDAGQELVIPKIETAMALEASPEASAQPSSSPDELALASTQPSEVPVSSDSKGAVMDQSWGTPIKASTYTVVAGDWLSKISGRAYGDIMLYEKIAKANNISDPNSIEVGTVLKIPRQ